MSRAEHHLFFTSKIENGIVYLDEDETRHARTVLRFANGDLLTATDGAGGIYECSVSDCTSRIIAATIIKKSIILQQLPILRACVGIPDKDIFFDMLENLAALGVNEIVPTICSYCQKQWWGDWTKQEQRIKKKLITGIKQSQNPWLPVCQKPLSFNECLINSSGTLLLTADPSGSRIQEIADIVKNASAVTCFIGPPGGFSDSETLALTNAGSAGVFLSNNRLRTELAATVLCSCLRL